MDLKTIKRLIIFFCVLFVALIITVVIINQGQSETAEITNNGDLIFVDNTFTAWEATSIIFGNDVGKISWDEGVLEFEGNLTESMEIFFDYLKPMIDGYIEDESKKIKGVSYKESGNYIAELEEKVEELTIEEGEDILFQFTTEGEFSKTFIPDLFLKIVNTDMSKCLIDDRLRLDLNGEIYWIRLER